MQFTSQYTAGMKFQYFDFNEDTDLKMLSFISPIMRKLGGETSSGIYHWKFPTFITSEVIKELIHNTCFVCGGLMEDGQSLQNDQLTYESYDGPMNNYEGEIKIIDPAQTRIIQVRKCTQCGHSHT